MGLTGQIASLTHSIFEPDQDSDRTQSHSLPHCPGEMSYLFMKPGRVAGRITFIGA